MQNDEDEINRLVLESEVIKRLKADKEMVLAANRSLADSNLEQRPVLERNKNELGGMYETLNEVQEEFRQKTQSLKTTRGKICKILCLDFKVIIGAAHFRVK